MCVEAEAQAKEERRRREREGKREKRKDRFQALSLSFSFFSSPAQRLSPLQAERSALSASSLPLARRINSYCASGEGFLSGWYLRACLRKARLISFLLACGDTCGDRAERNKRDVVCVD